MMTRRLLLLALAIASAISAVENRPTEEALADIHRIYIDQLGGGKTSDQFRDMLIAALQNTGLFVITENADKADATLKGSGDDLIFTDQHQSSDSIGVHANAGNGSSSRSLNSGVSSNATMGVGVSNNDESRIEERRHEATGSIRIVGKDGDVIWSTTQESDGGKFRSAMADVADKIVRQLADETRRIRTLAAQTRDGQRSGESVQASGGDSKPAVAAKQ
ncbi:MAG TPA: hypothetical protein VGL82_17540 [Bryobacteraceae bacterium]|jgi:hypothetical protein